jgi:hypothetical protein
VVDSPSDPVPASTKAVFDIWQLITTEKRAGLKNLHVVNLLPNVITPLPLGLNASALVKGGYLLRIPALVHPALSLGLVLSKALSERMGTTDLPKGLKVKRLSAADVELVKRHWLKREVRSEAAWEQVLKTYDLSRQFSLEARSKGVDLPVAIRAGRTESVMLLVRSGDLKTVKPGVVAKLTVQQTSARGALVGGSTYVFKRRG